MTLPSYCSEIGHSLWPLTGKLSWDITNSPPPRSTKVYIPPGSINRVPASTEAKAGKSSLLGGPTWDMTPDSKLLYPLYCTDFTVQYETDTSSSGSSDRSLDE